MIFVIGHAGRVRARSSPAARSSSRSSGRPACSTRTIDVRPIEGQIDDLIGRDPRSASRSGERVLVTTLTKRMAEDLTGLPAEA